LKSYNFHIELKVEKGIIGGIGLSNVDRDQGIADLGYWLGEEYWRQGYATEAAKVLLDYAFDKLKMRRVTIPVFVENKGSQALAKKLGAKREGRLRKAGIAKSTGKIHDEYIHGLLKEEWMKARKKLK